MSENLNTFCVLVNTVHDSVFIQFSFDIVTVFFSQAIWKKFAIQRIYLVCTQLYWKRFVSPLYVNFHEDEFEEVSLKTLYICHI